MEKKYFAELHKMSENMVIKIETQIIPDSSAAIANLKTIKQEEEQ